MALQDIINNVQTQVANYIASKLNLKPNEAAAVITLIQGAFALIEAEAVNRSGPLLLKDLAAKFPQFATVIETIPEVKALVAAA